MGNIGRKKRRIEVLPTQPVQAPAPAAPAPAPQPATPVPASPPR